MRRAQHCLLKPALHIIVYKMLAAITEKPELLGLTASELNRFVVGIGEKPYRARQLFHSMQARRVVDFSSMTDLPKTLRRILDDCACVTRSRVERFFEARDGARRYLLKLADGCEIEAVFMPELHRDTICISSQAGCPLACDFCMTGVIGLKRNLSAAEIVSQITLVLNSVYGAGERPPHGTNIVIMGMGEPLLNYDEAMKSVRIIADPEGLAIAPNRVTLSTAGIVPRIDDLAREEVRPRLAISLTAATDELRNRLFPINRKYPLGELIEACRRYPLRERERLTFEYVMLEGVNDSNRDAKDLVRLLSGIRAKVNLIPHNPAPELPYHPSPKERILEFQQVLKDAGVPAFIRRPRGRDISAACGQLAARHEATAAYGTESRH